jgi:hypothetical protein
MQPSGSCEEKTVLTERLARTRTVYANAVRTLEAFAGTAGVDFDQAFNYADIARLEFKRSRAALTDHVEEHDC